MAARTRGGRPLRLLTIVDEPTRECLAIRVAGAIRANEVLASPTDLFVQHAPPDPLPSDNGPEFTARAVRRRIERVGVKRLFAEPTQILQEYGATPSAKRLMREVPVEPEGGAERVRGDCNSGSGCSRSRSRSDR